MQYYWRFYDVRKCYILLKNEEKKKNELKILAEKLAGKEEHEMELSVLRSVEKVMLENSKILSALEENQKETIKLISCQGVINGNIVSLRTDITDYFSSLKEDIKSQNTQNVKVLEILNQMSVSLTKMDENMEIVNGLLQARVDKMNEVNCDAINSLKSIEQRIDNINKLPDEIAESIEELISNFGKTIEVIQRDFNYLSEDIEEQEKDRTKKFNLVMNEIRDAIEDNNEEMAEEIKKLTGQYTEFEKVISSIVEQMSHMAEEDIKIMKGFLNG